MPILKANVTAAALEVSCPHCGAPQPNPSDGSHLWTTAQVVADQGRYKITCLSG